jgi:hypothetical protein
MLVVHFSFISPYTNLVPRACDPWEGIEGSGIIRCRKPGILAKIELRIPFQRPIRFLLETDYPRASRSFPRIAGSGNEIAHTLVRTRTIPNAKDRVLQWHIQFSFKMAVFHWAIEIYISHNFVEFSKNCAGFSYGKYVGLHSGLSCVLNWCVFLCVTTRKPQNLDSANLYNIVD